MKISVTGALGQLGGELCRQIGPDAIPLDIDTLDLTDSNAVLEKMSALRPGLIINCAAYTQVDKAETEKELAYKVNAKAVEYLVQVCRKIDCPLVQISTDYVFGDVEKSPEVDNRVQGSVVGVQNSTVDKKHGVNQLSCPRKETDPTSPACVYAETKLAGEQAASQFEKHIIVRTCGLYAGPSDTGANNFVKTMLRLGSTKSELRVVADQHCTPSYVPHVAKAIMFLAGIGNNCSAPWGIYNVTNSGATTWHDFAVEIFKQAELNINVTPITTAEYGAPAARPSYSVLDTSKYNSLNGPTLPDWKHALKEYFSEWKAL